MKKEKNIFSKSEKSEVNRLVMEWRQKMFLNAWYIDIWWAQQDEVEGESGPAAETSIKWEYKNCKLTIFPCFFNETKERREQIIVHELAHCITNPLDELVYRLMKGGNVNDHERHAIRELVTQDVANAIFFNDVEAYAKSD